MNVYLDGQKVAGLPKDADAPNILSTVRGEVAKQGRVISEIRVDFVEVDEEAFSNITGGMAAHFKSVPVRDLIRDSLDDALEYAPRLINGFDEIAAHFEKNELAIAENKLAQAAEGLDWLLHVFENCSAILELGSNNDSPGIAKLRESLAGDIDRLGNFHNEKLYLDMSSCIRNSLLPDVVQFAAHVTSLRALVTSAQ
ncbi:hypothetical protein FACS1894187_02430 [Synergistales bacterium]|nr:hypothetical protein FACS1894187_02430 [Synergistales bacterium]